MYKYARSRYGLARVQIAVQDLLVDLSLSRHVEMVDDLLRHGERYQRPPVSDDDSCKRYTVNKISEKQTS